MNESVASLRYAGLTKRITAFALDYLIITSYLVVLLGVGITITTIAGPLEQISAPSASPILMDAIAFLTAILPVIMYFTFQEGSNFQATWGKRKVGIKVVNATGNKLSKRRAFLRSLVKFLPWQLAHTSLFHIKGWPFAPENPTPIVTTGLILAQVLIVAYIITLMLNKMHRTPYDWASGAFVIFA